MATKMARLCWNTNGWQRPAGVAALAERSETFAKIHGFGHEEWLFRRAHVREAWRFGFLECAREAGAALRATSHDVLLYTIDPSGTRWVLGEIRGLEFLSPDDAAAAVDSFRRGGWLATMRKEARAVGVEDRVFDTANARELVNVRFPVDGIAMNIEPFAAPPGHPSRRRGKNRYKLLYSIEESGSSTDGLIGPTDGYEYDTAPRVSADRRHNRIQRHLRDLLVQKYGAAAVAVEVGGVDITLRRPDGTEVFVEVKSDESSRLAVRDALGQLLEYALYRKSGREAVPQLCIVAPGRADEVDTYIADLATRFGLPVSYISFDEHHTTCPL